MKTKKTILVTGGAGFIGSVLVNQLLSSNNHKIFVLDNFCFNINPFKDMNSSFLKIIKADARYVNPKVFKDIDIVVDLAAISQPDSEEKIDKNLFYEMNYLLPIRICNLSKINGVKKYIYASTCSTYGFRQEIVSENSKPNPLDIYAKTKSEVEKIILDKANKGFSVTALRFATNYGASPKMRFDLMLNFMVLTLFEKGKIRVSGNGKQARPVVHVRDVARAIQHVIEAENKKVNQEVFNVGSNEQNFSVLEMAKKIFNILGLKRNIEFFGDPDKRSYRVNFDKIKKVLKFKAIYTPEQGTKEVYEGLKNKKIKFSDKTLVIKSWEKIQKKCNLYIVPVPKKYRRRIVTELIK